MRNIITIIILVLLSIGLYVPLSNAGIQLKAAPTVKDQIQQQLQLNQTNDGPSQPYCKKKIEKYKHRIMKLRAKDNLTLGQKWSLAYNKDQLKYWVEYCTTGVDPYKEFLE